LSTEQSETAVSRKLDALQRECRARSLPVTVQRRAVVEELTRHGSHPTVDELFAVVRQRLPGISRTTVYRILETLVEIGIADRVLHTGATVRYDARTEEHHHFSCDACDRVFDLEDLGIPSPKVPKSDTDGVVEIHGITVYLRGHCPDCRRKPAPASR
jgi:Fur family peroxide stress response transcriptional regulator